MIFFKKKKERKTFNFQLVRVFTGVFQLFNCSFSFFFTFCFNFTLEMTINCSTNQSVAISSKSSYFNKPNSTFRFSRSVSNKLATNLPIELVPQSKNTLTSFAKPMAIPKSVLPIVHSRIEYQHYFVPDILNIFNASFYWGAINRHVAERLLANKPEGTFLLRDSAQPGHLFSVSFRRFGQTLHARIEQSNHRFGFDPLDPSVYSSKTICQLLAHYKSPNHWVFFEPLLVRPLPRTSTFSLQSLCRARITSMCSYNNVQHLQLPVFLKDYLREYHYKVPIRSEQY